MFRTALLAAVVPLALGSEYSYTYDYTDAPTAAPTSLTAPPTTTGAPTRTDTYAPSRMTETPSYAPMRIDNNLDEREGDVARRPRPRLVVPFEMTRTSRGFILFTKNDDPITIIFNNI